MKILLTKTYLLILLALTISLHFVHGQGFLHVEGKKIVDGNGENYIIRGIGTGNWLLQEGYMMQTAGVAGTQYEFRNKLIETIGEDRTKIFYDSWLNNHFRKIDVDSMAAWGFNAVRVAMHYKWMTYPIEEEPVKGEHTWHEEGFQILDTLLSWCADNEMYLILDLHGAPGGQGANADISDYDPSKPSLWESGYNKDKTVALWRKLAERYHNEPWIGGYDLINETNWTFPEGNNSQLYNLYRRITDTIREVDNNHIIFIEGNGFANDFSGLTPAWDANMVYSFHKYWTYNDPNALDWVLTLREETNRPLWLGETGENSNTWFTNLVALAEENNIGWSWWPVKKSGINNILRVETNEDYLDLIEMWRGNGNMSADDAFDAVMTYSENHRFENCIIQRDVIDALTRQPYTTATIPFKNHETGSPVFAVDYDLGRVGYAYYDTDTADYHLNTDSFGTWNYGWSYRNDGVDIEATNDTDVSNGYHVGWIRDGEWLQYTLNSEQEAAYQLQIRTAGEENARIHVEVDGKSASKSIEIPGTGDWSIWQTTVLENIILPKGQTKVKLVFDKGGMNLNYFTFTNPGNIEEVPFYFLSANTDELTNQVYLNLNKPVTSELQDIASSGFQVIRNNALADISEIQLNPENNNQLIFTLAEELRPEDKIKISYQGNIVFSNEQPLTQFTGESVENRIYMFHDVPGKIEAEDFFRNQGFVLEECLDAGGGYNTGFANDGDYLDYIIKVDNPGLYNLSFRVAAQAGSPEIMLLTKRGEQLIANKVLKIEATGGWQTWETQSIELELESGKQIFRIRSRKGEYNINWFALELITGIQEAHKKEKVRLYPNPADDMFIVDFNSANERQLVLYDLQGRRLLSQYVADEQAKIDTTAYPNGNYILTIQSKKRLQALKVQIHR